MLFIMYPQDTIKHTKQVLSCGVWKLRPNPQRRQSCHQQSRSFRGFHFVFALLLSTSLINVSQLYPLNWLHPRLFFLFVVLKIKLWPFSPTASLYMHMLFHLIGYILYVVCRILSCEKLQVTFPIHLCYCVCHARWRKTAKIKGRTKK